ncbi:MAG: NifB/NifX family molybdenum-iron cluster-binding protein [Desulfurococcus sp.]|uniref:NifB/NifX family molybdenum-iron cluster-binding protein n=1 Tax=Desulfurococcus sp. TaxID=51678 RepID=UPI0031699051
MALPSIKTSHGIYLSPHFGRARFFTLAEVADGSHRIIKVVENPFFNHAHGRREAVVDFLVSQGVEAVISLGMGPGAFEKLRSRGVKIYYVEPDNSGKMVSVEKALEFFLEKKLVEATVPREHD